MKRHRARRVAAASRPGRASTTPSAPSSSGDSLGAAAAAGCSLEPINYRHGHRDGDEPIISTANLFRARRRANDVIARIAGYEFAALLPHASTEQAAVAGSLLEATHTDRGASVPEGLELSIAIVAANRARGDITGVFERADPALDVVNSSPGDGYATGSQSGRDNPSADRADRGSGGRTARPEHCALRTLEASPRRPRR